MKNKSTGLVSLLTLILIFSLRAFSQTPVITYQGKLSDTGVPPTGTFQMEFRLFDAVSGGAQIGTTVPNNSVLVTEGVFTVTLNFLSTAFPGAVRFLQISVRRNAGEGFVTLTPRQQIASSPYSIRTLSAAQADNANQLGGLPASQYLQTNGNGSGLTNLNASSITTGTLSNARLDQIHTANIADGAVTDAKIVTVGGGKVLGPVANATNAINATNAANATNALSLGGVAANQYLQTNGNGSGLTNLNGANITNNTINASALASETFPNNQNLSRLGSLRWDLLSQRVSVGTNPQFAAFDGANIWVVNNGSNNVTKLRALDGALQGTFAVGTLPVGVAFDGANIWVANNGSNNVTKLRVLDGAVQGTFAVGTGPFGVAFDGANIWVVNNASNNVTKLRASDGALQGTFPVGTFPRGVAFDGANIWVANNGGSATVTKLRASDGACVAPCTFVVGTGTSPYGIAFDGANMWITNNGSGSPSNFVTKLRVSDGTNLGNFAAGSGPFQVAFDGANIWVANGGINTVTKLRASDGALLGTFPGGGSPFGVAFDGANIWVTNNSNTVVKLPVFP